MSQTLSAATLLAVPLAPLAGSVLAGVLGTTFGGNRIGRAASHSATILGVFIAFVLSALTLKSVAMDGARFDATIYEWMVVGGLRMEVGFLVDGLTAMMMCVVTFVSLMVHIYTIGYMEEDAGYDRFFSYISLFTFSMLMLVMSNNFLQLFFGWEAVGLVSYLLIGFWYNKPTAIFANMKAFLVNRVGDFGFILGIGLIAAYAGTLSYGETFAKAGQLSTMAFPGTDWLLISGDLHLPVHRRHGQVGAVPAARVAARLDGRPDAHLGADPRGDHGDGRHLHGGAHVAAVRAVGRRAELHPGHRLHHRAVHGLSWASSRTTSSAWWPIPRCRQLGYMTVALGVSAYSRGRVPPDDARLLQGAAVPGGRLGHHRHAPRPGHPQHGRPAQVHAHHLDHIPAGVAWR
jgi:hypothetical protein